MAAMDRLWDHFLDIAQYAKTDGDRISEARAAIEVAIRRDVVDPRRIAEALVETDDDSHDLLDDGEQLGESFVVHVMPRARSMATYLYTDLRKAALRVIEATQPVERDAAILDLDCVVSSGDPCASLA